MRSVRSTHAEYCPCAACRYWEICERRERVIDLFFEHFDVPIMIFGSLVCAVFGTLTLLP